MMRLQVLLALLIGFGFGVAAGVRIAPAAPTRWVVTPLGVMCSMNDAWWSARPDGICYAVDRPR